MIFAMADPLNERGAEPLDRADSDIPFQDWHRLVTRPVGEEKRLACGLSVAEGVGATPDEPQAFPHSFVSTRM
jgi:hypothetical protein